MVHENLALEENRTVIAVFGEDGNKRREIADLLKRLSATYINSYGMFSYRGLGVSYGNADRTVARGSNILGVMIREYSTRPDSPPEIPPEVPVRPIPPLPVPRPTEPSPRPPEPPEPIQGKLTSEM